MRTLVAGLMVLGMSSAAWAAKVGMPMSADEDLINQIHAINELEQSMGKMALKQTKNPQVRDYAQKMIHDHSDADAQLKKVAKTMRAEVVSPDSNQRTPAEVADFKHQKAMSSQMSKETEPLFDRDYLKMMADGHQQAIGMLTSATPTDESLKGYVDSILPTVQEHERLAKDLLGANQRVGRRPMP